MHSDLCFLPHEDLLRLLLFPFVLIWLLRASAQVGHGYSMSTLHFYCLLVVVIRGGRIGLIAWVYPMALSPIIFDAIPVRSPFADFA